MANLTTEQVDKIKTRVLADRHQCSNKYVRMVLLGERATKSHKAKAIYAEGVQMIKAIENIQA